MRSLTHANFIGSLLLKTVSDSTEKYLEHIQRQEPRHSKHCTESKCPFKKQLSQGLVEFPNQLQAKPCCHVQVQISVIIIINHPHRFLL